MTYIKRNNVKRIPGFIYKDRTHRYLHMQVCRLLIFPSDLFMIFPFIHFGFEYLMRKIYPTDLKAIVLVSDFTELQYIQILQ